MSDDAWEKLRHITLDQFVTKMKLEGAGSVTVNGHTKPEDWPFSVLLVIGNPNNMGAVRLMVDLQLELNQRASWKAGSSTKPWPGPGRAE